MLRRALAAATVSSVLLIAVPAAAQAHGSSDGHGSQGGSWGSSHGGRGNGSGNGNGGGSGGGSRDAGYVEVVWATPVSSALPQPQDGASALWPQRIATDDTCGVWLQLDRYVPGSVTDSLVKGGVLYGPNNPTEVLATRYPYPETGHPWKLVKAPACRSTPATPTPKPSSSTPSGPHHPCPTPTRTSPPTRTSSCRSPAAARSTPRRPRRPPRARPSSGSTRPGRAGGRACPGWPSRPSGRRARRRRRPAGGCPRQGRRAGRRRARVVRARGGAGRRLRCGCRRRRTARRRLDELPRVPRLGVRVARRQHLGGVVRSVEHATLDERVGHGTRHVAVELQPHAARVVGRDPLRPERGGTVLRLRQRRRHRRRPHHLDVPRVARPAAGPAAVPVPGPVPAAPVTAAPRPALGAVAVRRPVRLGGGGDGDQQDGRDGGGGKGATQHRGASRRVGGARGLRCRRPSTAGAASDHRGEIGRTGRISTGYRNVCPSSPERITCAHLAHRPPHAASSQPLPSPPSAHRTPPRTARDARSPRQTRARRARPALADRGVLGPARAGATRASRPRSGDGRGASGSTVRGAPG